MSGQPRPLADVHPEVAYDLVLDHQALIMALDRRTRSLTELAATLGETQEQVAERLAELLAAGLVVDRSGGFAARTATYELLRQESGVDFLRDQVLPSLAPVLVGGEPEALLLEAEGRLGGSGVPGLETELLAGFGETLGRIQEQSVGRERRGATLLLYGTTSEPPGELGSPAERAIWRLRTASRQRDEERALGTPPRSLIYQYRVLLDELGWRRTREATDLLVAALERSEGTTRFGITMAGLRRSSTVAEEVC